MNDRLVLELPRDGTKGTFLKVLAVSLLLYLLWLGISTSLFGSEIQELQNRIRVLENNVTALASALSKADQAITA